MLVSSEWIKEWEVKTSLHFPVGIYGDVFCFADPRNGKFAIVGRKLEVLNDEIPILVPELSEFEIIDVEESVEKKFGIKGEFHFFFVKNN